jgi:hypothetical protein
LKNLIIIFILFFLQGYYLVTTTTFSQEFQSLNNKLIIEPMGYNQSQSSSLLQGYNLSNYFSRSNLMRPDTVKKKSWWEPLLDLSFWTKLSGPGPFLGIGFDYPVFKFTDNLALFVGTSFSHSIDNTLKYYKTISLDTPSTLTYDSCISCRQSKAVEIFSLKVEAQYHWPRSPVDFYIGGGIHTFFGETFESFSRISMALGAGVHVLKYLRLGMMVNIFNRFKPDSFGAMNSSDVTNSIELIPGAFINVSLH